MMAEVPRYNDQAAWPERQEPALPSLLSFSAMTAPADTLPPLAVARTAKRPASVMSGSIGAIESLVRPVVPRFDFRQAGASQLPSSRALLPPPGPFHGASAFPLSDRYGHVDAAAAPTRAWSPKTESMAEKPRAAALASPLTRTRQAEPAAELGAPDPAPATGKRPRVRTQRRREQCRTNQARYRLRQNRRIQHMEDSAARLREEIALLLAYRARWASHDPRERAPLMARYIVEEYFRRFRSGLSGANIQLPLFTKAPSDEPASPSSSTTSNTPKLSFNFKAECNNTYTKQVAFLRTVFLADADIGDGLFGPDAVLEQWWRYSCFFKRVHLSLDTLRARPHGEDARCDRVIATGTLTVKVSSHSLERVFPHVDPDSSDGAALKDQVLELPLRAQFEFVPESGSFSRVASMYLDIDVLPELLRVVGSSEVVHRLMSGALLSPCGHIGSLEEHPTGDNAA